MTRLFLVLAALLLILVGVAAFRDTEQRDYLSIQEQYQKDYPGSDFETRVQQIFPEFSAAKRGDTFRIERCISCHVPDISAVGPEVAAKHLASDFFKYEPDAKHIAQANHLTGVHPAYIDSKLYSAYGAGAFRPYQYSDQTSHQKKTTELPGFIPTFLSPDSTPAGRYGIDQVGCIVCHNGSRLALDEQHAHQNLIINPQYAWSEGAAIYYANCATCHGGLGEGGVGPPLSNQDRLGFFNEDYYYRCIEYGFTDFEHYGSVMPAWGTTASDFQYDPQRDKQKPSNARVLSEDQIHLLVQFIRHWEAYDTLP
ncbi:MAG TPA: cytochrome c [Candidatus Sulfotelmatobacter sp.]|nr:cytochrome c [Candidatus Sulfotelmatobacter sp.]